MTQPKGQRRHSSQRSLRTIIQKIKEQKAYGPVVKIGEKDALVFVIEKVEATDVRTLGIAELGKEEGCRCASAGGEHEKCHSGDLHVRKSGQGAHGGGQEAKDPFHTNHSNPKGSSENGILTLGAESGTY